MATDITQAGTPVTVRVLYNNGYKKEDIEHVVYYSESAFMIALLDATSAPLKYINPRDVTSITPIKE